MATRKRSSSRASSRARGGSTLLGLLVGLFTGLLIAAMVAFYITGAPVPFVDRASREAARHLPTDPARAPDPNRGLQARGGSTPEHAPMVPVPEAPGGSASPARPLDDLGALIATLDTRPQTGARAPSSAAPAPSSASADTAAHTNAPAAGGTYFLQVGAYRVVEDAEALRARILLLGLPVSLQRAEVNGALVNRVRVGPYRGLDEMNRARTRLGQERIVSTVVRQ